MDWFPQLFGYLGGIFIMVSFIPQVIKSYRTKSVDDLSFKMILATFFSTVFLLVYGFLINELPIILNNIVLGITVLFQAYLKIKYDKKR
jgi:MtN3 and saliva related transmembrane protein